MFTYSDLLGLTDKSTLVFVDPLDQNRCEGTSRQMWNHTGGAPWGPQFCRAWESRRGVVEMGSRGALSLRQTLLTGRIAMSQVVSLIVFLVSVWESGGWLSPQFTCSPNRKLVVCCHYRSLLSFGKQVHVPLGPAGTENLPQSLK